MLNLSDNIKSLKYIDTKYSDILSRLNIFTVKDLLTYFPYRYIDNTQFISINELLYTTDYTNKHQIKGRVKSFRNAFIRGGRTIQTLKIYNDTDEINTIFFNQKYLATSLIEGKEYIFVGKVRIKGKKNIFYPETFDLVRDNEESNHLGIITPEYFLTEGLSKKWLRNRIKELINALDLIKFESFLNEFDLKNSLKEVHFPESFESLNTSIRNLSLIELINIQLKLSANRELLKKYTSIKLKSSDIKKDLKNILEKIPFKLTADQEIVLKRIIEQLNSTLPINSLLEGDVGSGKTIIAIILSYLLAKQGFQTVILAPTTILAKQHYQTFCKYIDEREVSIKLIIGSNKENQSSDILIGTSAILSRKSNLINNLGLIIVDEQHRFGVSQREDLLKPIENLLVKDSDNKVSDKSIYPHFINMTATPIPRTLAQLIFQDITIYQIHQKPKGRLPIISYLVPPKKKNDSIDWIIEKIKLGEQVYWICPLIESSETVNAKSSEEVFNELTNDKRFKDIKIGLMHGRLKDNQKIEILEKFNNKEIDLLISTSVIEVGIDVKNATIIVIENGERFGLAQLHQMRGRVGRGDKQSYCLIFYGDNLTKDKLNRLEFFSKNNDGFELSEYDLNNRGPGEIYGFKQSGVPYLKLANLNDLDLIQESRAKANKLYAQGIRNIELFQ